MPTVDRSSFGSRIVSWLIDSFAAYGEAIAPCPTEWWAGEPEEDDPDGRRAKLFFPPSNGFDHMGSPICWPRKTGESEVPGWDSARWNDFAFRDNDIVVATYPKSGTTLTQQILAQLVFGGDPNIYGAAANLSPWLEFRLSHDAVDVAAAQEHRRFLKTHLPAKNLVISPKAKYIVVARDVRDVVWSFHHHQINVIDRDSDQPLAPDVRQYYHDFLDGPGQQFPYWSHIQSWWDVRHLPNLLTLHYADLIADLPTVVRRIAAFLAIPIDEARFPQIVSHCSIEHMRKVAQDDPSLNKVFREGSKTFINQGTNGRWRDVLTVAEIEKADHLAARELTPDCASWLRSGLVALPAGEAREHLALAGRASGR